MTPEILLIEDNGQNRYLLSYLLTKHGYRVREAVDGPEGMRMAGERAPALILLDIQLPGMDGYEVARRLKKDDALRAVPVIAVTSYAMTGDRERCIEAGCDGYIEKPVDPATFVAQVEAILSNQCKPGPEA